MVLANKTYNIQDKHKKPKQLNLTQNQTNSGVVAAGQETDWIYSNKEPKLPGLVVGSLREGNNSYLKAGVERADSGQILHELLMLSWTETTSFALTKQPLCLQSAPHTHTHHSHTNTSVAWWRSG